MFDDILKSKRKLKAYDVWYGIGYKKCSNCHHFLEGPIVYQSDKTVLKAHDLCMHIKRPDICDSIINDSNNKCEHWKEKSESLFTT